MRVFLDDQPIPIATPTLAAALAAVRESAERGGRIVVEVFRNGQPVPQAILERPSEEPDTDAEVRCASADPRLLVADSLRQAAQELAASRESHAAAAKAIQTSRLEEAMPHLSSAMATWTQVHAAVTTGAELLGLDPSQPITPGGPALAESVRQLSTRLAEVKRTLQAQDWSGLADSMAYDLPELIDHWGRLLTALADEVAPIR